jgi:3-oxoadipate enol-lactonase
VLINAMEVEKTGSGPALVLVHGLGGTGNFWFPQLTALSATFTVYRPDTRGSGRSPLNGRNGGGNDNGNGKLTIDQIVADLIGLLDHEKIERAAFVGHSFGSLVVQHLAAKHPDRVTHVALVGPVRAPADANRQGPRDRAAKVRAEGMIAVADVIVAAALSPATRANKPVAVSFVRELLLRQDPAGYAATCEALADAVEVDYAAIVAPTLLLTGKDDGVGSPATAQALKDLIADARLTVLDDCGHWTAIEQPERVGEALTQFLK